MGRREWAHVYDLVYKKKLSKRVFSTNAIETKNMECVIWAGDRCI